MKTKKVFRKAVDIKESGRSSDFITPSFIYECALNCSYCYVKRHGAEFITIAKNVGDLLTAVNNHVTWLPEKEPNQTHNIYYTYDIGCNSDIGLHRKQIDWRYIFDFFKGHDRAMATFATKVIPVDFLNYNPQGKVRIRFSLMPQKISSILEPNTAEIIDRIKAIDAFIEAGYDVHVNYSPVVVYDGWLDDYEELFMMMDQYVEYKELVKSEVIFLTHNESKHLYNLQHNVPGEDLLWTPDIQEGKISSYGGKNVRYRYDLKREYIAQFKELHEKIIPFNTIRYIF
jgi:spore photoproduct lyase